MELAQRKIEASKTKYALAELRRDWIQNAEKKYIYIYIIKTNTRDQQVINNIHKYKVKLLKTKNETLRTNSRSEFGKGRHE